MKQYRYKRFTIKSLINSLNEVMSRNPEITLDSEIIISDLNMNEFKHEFRVYPTHDYKDGQTKIGIYLNNYEKDELLDTIEVTEQVSEQVTEQVSEQVEEVADEEWFGCNPGINTAHLKMKTSDLLNKFLPKINHRAKILAL